MASKSWIDPTSCNGSSLSLDDVKKWKEEGYCLVNGLLPLELLEQVKQDALNIFPAPGSETAKQMTDFGGGLLNFPSTIDSVNQVALHHNIQQTVSTLLDTMPHNLRLTQAEVWPKYGYTSTSPDSNSDQRIHCDFPNHTLTHPPPWNSPEAVEMIIYLSNVADCQGATALVARQGEDDPAYQYPITEMPGFGLLEWKNNKTCAEEYLREMAPQAAEFRATHLYPRESYANYNFGTILFYRHDTWHRGTELQPGCLRIVMNLTFRKKECEWVSTLHCGWAWGMYRRGLQMERLVSSSTVEQRCLLGFPEPGNKYWTHQTLLAVAARYGPLGIDMTPYLEAAETGGVV